MAAFDRGLALRYLKDLQSRVRDLVIASRDRAGLHEVDHASEADTIYAIDAVVEPAILEVCRAWANVQPMVLIAEGIKRDDGTEGPVKLGDGAAIIRVILDPIDGTRGIMYDKRPAWALGGVAPEKGEATRLRDIAVACMTELPTRKMGQADVLSAIEGQGAIGERVDLETGEVTCLPLRPSSATTINHGFASVSNFFPGTKELASRLMEAIVRDQIGPADLTRATVFDDQYISTGGQWYELIVGHDRFNCDLRPAFYAMQQQGEGLCCHPYDCATLLVAEEAGIVMTDEKGEPLNGPLDTTTGLNWVGYANDKLRQRIEPVVQRFFKKDGTDGADT